MDLDAHLDSVQLLDCSGQVSHTLTLLVDGRVRIRFAGREAIVDPRSRRNLTPQVPVHDTLMDSACALAGGRV
ncbi:MAG: hypothetical protein ACXIVQ_13715 [Acidimicrobiales bacterium]